MYCLDTNILIDALRGEQKVARKIRALTNLPIKLATTPICLLELYKGAYMSSRVEENLLKIRQAIKPLEILEFNEEVYHTYAKSFVDLARAGKMTHDTDLMIAALCIVHDKKLITKNIKHFENIPLLKTESW
ncbi:type II toxin-antitoxin system VapC family toxin [Candidatus Woesearchaeota archaeon]|nr:type II toxin-antitoxin system VapC family toxin [Candidatus Woesearchaeota archaeon]